VFSKSSPKVTIFCLGALINANRVDDASLAVGIAAAVPYTGGKEARYNVRPLGKTVSPFDADTAAIDSGISLTQTILSNLPTSRILILTTNPSAITVILKAGPHSGQPYPSTLDRRLTTFFHSTGTSRLISPAPRA
jgi:energy-coupling factor transporter transmembrane protein EcfT